MGMIEVGVEVEWLVTGQHPAQLRRDQTRRRDRRPAADTDDLQVGNRPQPPQQIMQGFQRQQQRIAAGKHHVAQLRRRGDVVNGSVNIQGCRTAAHLPFAHTETAVDGTAVRDQQYRPVGVAMDQTGHRTQAFFIQRIRQLRNIRKFQRIRHALTPDRIPRLLDQSGIVAGQTKGVPFGHLGI